MKGLSQIWLENYFASLSVTTKKQGIVDAIFSEIDRKKQHKLFHQCKARPGKRCDCSFCKKYPFPSGVETLSIGEQPVASDR